APPPRSWSCPSRCCSCPTELPVRPGEAARLSRIRLPGPVRPGARAAVAGLELPDLGPDVNQVDRGRDERRDRQDRDGRRAANVEGVTKADDHRDTEDDQPDGLGLLTRGYEGRGRPAYRVDERESLEHERGDRDDGEEDTERRHR